MLIAAHLYLETKLEWSTMPACNSGQCEGEVALCACFEFYGDISEHTLKGCSCCH